MLQVKPTIIGGISWALKPFLIPDNGDLTIT
jgi:hypothetical protein